MVFISYCFCGNLLIHNGLTVHSSRLLRFECGHFVNVTCVVKTWVCWSPDVEHRFVYQLFTHSWSVAAVDRRQLLPLPLSVFSLHLPPPVWKPVRLSLYKLSVRQFLEAAASQLVTPLLMVPAAAARSSQSRWYCRGYCWSWRWCFNHILREVETAYTLTVTRTHRITHTHRWAPLLLLLWRVVVCQNAVRTNKFPTKPRAVEKLFKLNFKNVWKRFREKISFYPRLFLFLLSPGDEETQLRTAAMFERARKRERERGGVKKDGKRERKRGGLLADSEEK